MVAETIEGEVIEHGLTVIEPRAVSLGTTPSPEDMVALASRMATALKDIVDRQKLYAVIQGKKYPQVEAWMTIARMDNVVARESDRPIRHDDGSYEAFVELIRLSDGMVIGAASALCGTPDDRPWNTRSEPARRSMAVTRATSRAFRQQYSWIMALAGYEPTPMEEMPQDRVERPAPTTNETDPGGLIGSANLGKKGSDADWELRMAPDGHVLVFRLDEGRKGWKAIAHSPLSEQLAEHRAAIEGQRVTCWGRFEPETFNKTKPDGTVETIKYQVLHLTRIETPAGAFPQPVHEAPSTSVEDDADLSGLDTVWGGPADEPR